MLGLSTSVSLCHNVLMLVARPEHNSRNEPQATDSPDFAGTCCNSELSCNDPDVKMLLCLGVYFMKHVKSAQAVA